MPEHPAERVTAVPPRTAVDRRSRGQLWIYLGAVPGVGKTRAMLAGARKLQAQGRDVVIAALASSTDPRAQGFEFAGDPARFSAPISIDVVGVLLRQPGMCLVQGLAHKNPEGARHRHRWQDVQEILDNGIDVHATLDVLNVEGLLDAVHEITPVRVREWIPDAFLAQASEVIFVDLPWQLLRGESHDAGGPAGSATERLRRGGLDPARLVALRNLALQCALDHNRLMARNRLAVADHVPEIPKVLVYLDTMADAQGLLHAGKRVAGVLHAGWLVAYRDATRRVPADEEREQLESSLQLAQQLGADVLALEDSTIGQRIIDLVGRYNIGSVVLAKPERTLWQGRHARAALRALERQAPGVDVVLVAPGRAFLAREPPTRPEAGLLPPMTGVATNNGSTLRAALWTIAVPALATIVSTTLFRHSEPTNHLLIYLLGVLYLATRHGFWPSAMAALLSVLASDFLLIAPYYSFAIARPQDLVTLAVFLSAAIVASRLADNLRFQGERARQREQQVRFLYEFTNALADVPSMTEVVALASQRISREFGTPCQLLMADSTARLNAPVAAAGATTPHFFELALAQQAFDTRTAIGWGQGGRNRRAQALYVPVSAAAHRFGVLALGPLRDSRGLMDEKRRMIDTLASQIAQCLERMRLTKEAQAAHALAQTESLRNSLLNSIAHDFRTPLASIVAASSTLALGKDRLLEGQAQELAQSILEEGQRMAQLANNTLEMARLEAGNVRLQREWYPLDEIVGAAVTRLRSRLSGHPLRTRLPDGVPMAQVDAVMIVQVLENLMENALKYTPPGAPIEIGADEHPGQAVFWVADDGPGIPAGEERAIFEKFYRGRNQENRGGVGLGLTISRIIVNAHGGEIFARNRDSGGAEFRFTIPCTESRPELTASA